MLDWLEHFLSNLWWGLADPPVVYRVDFVNGTIENKIDAPRLWIGTSSASPGNPDQNPVPPAGGVNLGNGGLLLSITKSPTDTRATVMVALSPKPAVLRRFRMVANCSLPEGLAPSHAGNQWAAILVARDGDKLSITDSTFIGATHQVRGGVPDIALGVAGAVATSGPQIIASQLVYPDHLPKVFRLQADLDCDAGLGRSRLYTPYQGLTWRERSWTPVPSFDMRTEITAIGVGIGFTATSSGRPTVLVKDFAIHLYVPQRWWRRTVAAVARSGSRAISALRHRTEDPGL